MVLLLDGLHNLDYAEEADLGFAESLNPVVG